MLVVSLVLISMRLFISVQPRVILGQPCDPGAVLGLNDFTTICMIGNEIVDIKNY